MDTAARPRYPSFHWNLRLCSLALGFFANSTSGLPGAKSPGAPGVRPRQIRSGIWSLANPRANASHIRSCWGLAWGIVCTTIPAPQDKQAELCLCLLVHGYGQCWCVRGMACRSTPAATTRERFLAPRANGAQGQKSGTLNTRTQFVLDVAGSPLPGDPSRSTVVWLRRGFAWTPGIGGGFAGGLGHCLGSLRHGWRCWYNGFGHGRRLQGGLDDRLGDALRRR